MATQRLSPAQIEANRAGTLIAHAVYLEDPRECVSDGSILHGLSPAFRAEPTRSGRVRRETKTLAGQHAARCAYSDKAYIVAERWDSRGRHPVESVECVECVECGVSGRL